jgi:undecaprenyl phosphate-alpha-L-ara4N flippase subunit ArnE
MTPFILFLIILSQFFLVGGQLLIKHAMNLTHLEPKPVRGIVGFFAMGIGTMTLCFFMWLAFLQKLQLSHVFPFEGLSPVILIFGAALFLKEKINPQCWIGIVLISCGIVLVSLS